MGKHSTIIQKNTSSPIKGISLLIALLVFFALYTRAQNPYYYTITDANELPSNEVYDLYQDKVGYIWIACEAGLVRYDGNIFKTFFTPTNCGRAVSKIKEDSNGRLYVRDFLGNLIFLDKNADTLKDFLPFRKIKKNFYSDFIVEKNNHIWISTHESGLYRYKPYSTDLQKQTADLFSNTYQHNFFYYGDNIWATGIKSAKGNRLFKINLLQHKTDSFFIADVHNSVYLSNTFNKDFFDTIHVGGNTRVIYADRSSGRIWYYNPGLNQFMPDAEMSKYLLKYHLDVLSVKQSKNGDIWICSTKGVVWLRPDNAGRYTEINYLWPDKSVSFFLEDKEGNYWFSSLQGGLYIIPNYQMSNFGESVLPKNYQVKFSCIDKKGDVYFCIEGGDVYKWDCIRKQCSLWWKVAKPEIVLYGLSYNSFNNSVYVSFYDQAEKKNKIYFKNTVSRNSGFINSIFKPFCVFTSSGYLIATTNNGIEVAFLNTTNRNVFIKNFNAVIKDSTNPNSSVKLYEGNRSRSVVYDSVHERIWGGFDDGLRYFEKNKQPQVVSNVESSIYAITSGKQSDHLWVGTDKMGLYYMEGIAVKKHFTKENGLLDNRISDIKFSDENVYIVTGRGIQIYDSRKNIFYSLTRTNGLNTYLVTDIEVRNGVLYIASAQGMQYISTDAIINRSNVAPLPYVAINKINAALYSKDTLFYTYNQTQPLEIIFTPITFKNKAEIRCLAILNGDTTIINPIERNSISYSISKAGTYQFSIRTLHQDGKTGKETKLVFIITTPWRVYLFWMLSVSLIAGFIAFVILYYRRKKSIIEEQLRRSEMNSLQILMNPHFIFNALNSIQRFMLMNDKVATNAYLGKFAKIMRSTLSMSEKETIPLPEEVENLRLYLELESIRYENFSYELTVDPAVERLHIPPMLIQPYIENAFKHGLLHKGNAEKRLIIHFDLADKNLLHCMIKDNGIGRSRSEEIKSGQTHKQHIPFATTATQKRLQLLNYKKKKSINVLYTDLKDSNMNAIGTQVDIFIGFKKEALN